MKKVFLNGIAGTGMSALAGLFHESGWEVSGSDLNFYPPVGGILRNMGVQLFNGFTQENIKEDTDLYIIGNVISRGNPEAERILNENFEYCSMAEALFRYFIKGNLSIVVAGTHGKTTITSFIAYLLSVAGRNPGFFIGGKPRNFPANYRVGKGDFFVSEGDEYETAFFDRSAKFLKYHPRCLILTSLEYDHLDIYPQEFLYRKSFTDLIDTVPAEGLIVSHADFPMNASVTARAHTPVSTYGERKGDCRIVNMVSRENGYSFTLLHQGREENYFTPLPGRYNVFNLTAGILLGKWIGIKEEEIREAVSSFSGVERRLQLIGRRGEILFLEDFAHHPTAIASVLSSLREGFPGKKLTALFEPRSWSLRRNHFQKRLADSLAEADTIVLQEVFQKEKIPTGERLDLDAVADTLRRRGRDAVQTFDYEEIRKWIQEQDGNTEQVIVLLSNGSFGDLPAYIRSMNGTLGSVKSFMKSYEGKNRGYDVRGKRH